MAKIRIVVVYEPGGSRIPSTATRTLKEAYSSLPSLGAEEREYLKRYVESVAKSPREALSSDVKKVIDEILREGGEVLSVETKSVKRVAGGKVFKRLFAVISARVPDYRLRDLVKKLEEMKLENARVSVEVREAKAKSLP